MCKEEVTSLGFDTLSLASAQDYWKLLKKFYGDNVYSKVVFNGLVFQISDNTSSASLYSPMCMKPIMEKITFFNFLLSGYGIIGTEDENVFLFSPKGKLKIKFVYKKEYYSSVCQTVKNGIIRYCSGYTILTRFIFSYNTIAVRCQNKCYLAKANKFDLNKLFYVGEYEDIEEMDDNKEGLVYVRFKNGKVKIFNKEFKEIQLQQGIKRILFLENSDFFIFKQNECYLYNKKANIIDRVDGIASLFNKDFYKNRFYQIGNAVYDCYTHKKCDKDIVAIAKNTSGTLYFEKQRVFFAKTSNRTGLNKIMFNDILFNVDGKISIINNKFLAFGQNKKVFVIEIGKSNDEIKAELKDFIEKNVKSDDLDLNTFDYFREFSSYLIESTFYIKDILCNKLN